MRPESIAGSEALDYWVDACQRSILFWDVMRKRGNIALEHHRGGKPPVLVFDYETVLDGRNLERPVNYALLRILPKDARQIDPAKRPFVIVDPRAGHGPGIGGFKEASQVGVAMRAGHPCYFISFYPNPVAGQRIEDIALAEAVFIRHVAALHPDCDGNPVVIGNCQAGWAIMLMAAAAPELAGVICIAGSPLSYWAGTRGKHPLRYTGGLLGGSWLASFTSDLGNGIFDGVHLVSNFENLDPANTLWSKQYNVYSKVDTEEERFLGFERWWGGHFLLTGEEMRFIVDELFVGNKLTKGSIVSSNRRRIDLKAIRAPIVVIASWGDNITPPQQALNWITDLYDSVDEIRANGQTIIYTLHDSIGHLGIFVSAKVALKQHKEVADTIEFIDTLPPGLYEMLIEETHAEEAGTQQEHDEYAVRFEARSIEDIRALDDGREDERPFATVARISEMNEALYNTFMAPFVRACSNQATATWLRLMHPQRLWRLALSDLNPAMWPLRVAAEQVRAQRRPVAADNQFAKAEKTVADGIEQGLNAYRDMSERWTEQLFFSIYESPVVEAIAGTAAPYADAAKPRGRQHELEALLERHLKEVRADAERGGIPEAILRILLACMQAGGGADVHAARLAEQARRRHDELKKLSHQQVKEIVRKQALLVRFNPELAMETLPKLLPTLADRDQVIEFVRDLVGQLDAVRPEIADVLQRIRDVLKQPPGVPPPPRPSAAEAQRVEAERARRAS
jgi:pimeloyl-ACP methyl ester carboxylesterase